MQHQLDVSSGGHGSSVIFEVTYGAGTAKAIAVIAEAKHCSMHKLDNGWDGSGGSHQSYRNAKPPIPI